MTEAQVNELFSHKHLPEDLQRVSQPFHLLAMQIHSRYDSDEGTIALRKLWEVKNLVVWCEANK